jgi:hypothetical protein
LQAANRSIIKMRKYYLDPQMALKVLEDGSQPDNITIMSEKVGRGEPVWPLPRLKRDLGIINIYIFSDENRKKIIIPH